MANPDTPVAPLLTIAQVAKILGVSERTVRRLIETGALPVVRIRGAVRIDPAALKKIIRSK